MALGNGFYMFYRGLGSCKLELGLTSRLCHRSSTGQSDPPSAKAKTQGRLADPRDRQQVLRLAKTTRQGLTPPSKAFRGPQGWTRTSREHDSAKHPVHRPSSKIIFKALLKYFWVFLFPC